MLPFNSANVVLGVEWLKGLDPVITDYTTLNMHFTYTGLPVQLQADVAYGTTSISTHLRVGKRAQVHGMAHGARGPRG